MVKPQGNFDPELRQQTKEVIARLDKIIEFLQSKPTEAGVSIEKAPTTMGAVTVIRDEVKKDKPNIQKIKEALKIIGEFAPHLVAILTKVLGL